MCTGKQSKVLLFPVYPVVMSLSLLIGASDLQQAIIICPIAIAYSMGQIIKSFCVCACVRVCLSVCGHSHGRISSSIFTKLDTDV